MTTIDLELAKELKGICKEKGIELPDHYWGWFYQEITESNILLPMFTNTLSEYLAPAYTLDEILEWLPKYIQIDDDDENDFDVYYRGLNWSIDPDGWIAEYQAYMYHSKSYCAEFDTNSANAACKLLIYLIKEGLI
jgi:hypothetical protein